jgi:DNA-directed RNA polymerase specialized sigma subunit
MTMHDFDRVEMEDFIQRVAKSIASRCLIQDADKEDVEQDGIVAGLEAVAAIDPSRTRAEKEHFLRLRIDGAIKNSIRENYNPLVPRATSQRHDDVPRSITNASPMDRHSTEMPVQEDLDAREAIDECTYTSQERQFVDLCSEGHSLTEVAHKLNVSVKRAADIRRHLRDRFAQSL